MNVLKIWMVVITCAQIDRDHTHAVATLVTDLPWTTTHAMVIGFVTQSKDFIYICSMQIDINECAEEIHRCEHNCSNTDGSYACRCALGYRVDRNGYSCNGIYKINLVFKAHWRDIKL